MRLMSICLLACAILLPGIAFAQAVSILPAQPKIGDRIEVRYDESAPGSAIRGATSMHLEAMIMCLDDSPVLKESEMEKEGRYWKGTFDLAMASARLVVLRIVSGEQVEDNNGRPMSVPVCGESGKPLEDAHRQNAAIMLGQGTLEFKHIPNFTAGRAEIQKERDLYPGNYRTWITEWGLMRREKPGPETQEAIRKDLAAYEERFGANEIAMVPAVGWMQEVGLQAKADSIRSAQVKANPRGKMAEEARRGEVYKERDPARGAQLLEKFMADFPQTGVAATGMNQMLVSLLIRAGRTEQAIALVKDMPEANAMMYNQVAWPLIEKGEQIDRAVELASTGVALARKPPPSGKPPHLRSKDWNRQNAMSLGMILDTYGLGLSKQGKYNEAAQAYKEAFGILKEDDPDVSGRYVDCLLKMGNAEEALAVSREVYVSGKTSEQLSAYYRQAFVKVKGSDSEFDAELSAAEAGREKSARAKIVKSRLNKPAVDFALKDLSGRSVQLSSLKGKVVVIDFWATWCGPCRSSFPTLQKIYDRYRRNEGVAIFAVNTWERQSGQERQALVEKFMADNKYTFPVLYDQGFVERYGVDGIPTKFVLDKKGNIAFKTIGFNGADEMMSEMTIQLDMLLAE